VLSERAGHRPAANPNVDLRLRTNSSPDVLVLYDEYELSSGKVSRRAFYLFSNESRLMSGRRPNFVRAADAQLHTPIPIYTSDRSSQTALRGDDMYALSTSPTSYQLWSRDRILAEFELPAYDDWLTARKVVLFPLAVAADAVGVGASVGAAAAAGAVESAAKSGASFNFP
jgi:hypothetical protein